MSDRERRGSRDRDSGHKRYGSSYHSREAMDKRASQQGGARDYFIKEDFPVIVVKSTKDGENLRVMPATWDNPKHWGLDVYIHFGVGPDNASYLCLDKMLGKRCPVCEERKKAEKGGDAEYIKSLAPTKRVLMYVIDRANEDAGPKIWTAPWTVDKDICKQTVDKQTGDVYFIDDVDEGYDIHIEREGEMLKTKYFTSLARRPSPLGREKQMKAWLKFIEDNPLTEVLNYFDYDYIKKVFSASGSDEDEEEETVRNSDRGKSRAAKHDEEEEKEERSSRKSRSTKREEEEEEEEEEKPRGRARREEEEEEEEEEERKVDVSYDDVMSMKRSKLESIALDEDLVSEEELDDMSDKELRKVVCESLDLKPPKKSSESSKERMRNMRDRA